MWLFKCFAFFLTLENGKLSALFSMKSFWVVKPVGEKTSDSIEKILENVDVRDTRFPALMKCETDILKKATKKCILNFHTAKLPFRLDFNLKMSEFWQSCAETMEISENNQQFTQRSFHQVRYNIADHKQIHSKFY